MTQTIRLNGTPREVAATTVVEMLVELGIDPQRRGLAVALEGTVVPRRAWGETLLVPGADLEIVRPLAGG